MNTIQIVGVVMLIGALLFVYFGLWFLAIRDAMRPLGDPEGIVTMLMVTIIFGAVFYLIGSVQ